MISLNKIGTQFLRKEDTLHNILTSIRPLNTICKFIGINSTQIEENRFVSRKPYQYYYFSFFMVVYTLLSVYSVTYILMEEQNFALANRYIVFTECSVMCTLMLVVVTFTFLFRNLQVKALDLLSYIDLSFAQNGYKLQYKKLLKNNYVILAIICVSLIARSSLMWITMHAMIVQQITMVLSITVKTFSKYLFVVLVLQLQMRFTKINHILRSLYGQNSSQTGQLVLDPAVKKIPEKLYVLCRLHYKLGSVTQKINSAFAVQLLGSIAVSLFDVLFQSYYLYYVAAGKSPVIKVHMIVNPIVWLLDEAVEIYWLVYACASTCDQANETATILHELRNNYFDLDLENHIQTYSLQMLHQKVQFSVLGFFEIDYTLIYSIVGAVTTYLVIFIQFDQSSHATDSSNSTASDA